MLEKSKNRGVSTAGWPLTLTHSHHKCIQKRKHHSPPPGIPKGSLLLTHLTLDTLQPKSKNETRMWLSMPDEKSFKINHTCGCLKERGVIERRRITRRRNEFLPHISMSPEP